VCPHLNVPCCHGRLHLYKGTDTPLSPSDSMARTRTKKNSLPPPARLLGNELGKHPAQLPPQLLAPQKITGPRMLLVSWNAVSLAPNRAASTLIAPRKDGADPLQIFLPRPKDGWIRLSDHRNALETIHLHPKMQLNRYLRKSRAKHAQWSSFGWGTVINVGAKETLLVCRANVDKSRLRRWNEYVH
jgi:hypothetical protein